MFKGTLWPLLGELLGGEGVWELEGQDLCQIDGADPGRGPQGSEKQVDSGWILQVEPSGFAGAGERQR